MKANTIRRCAAMLLGCLMLAASLGLAASAAGAIDTGRTSSLTLRLGDDNEPYSGAEFAIYRVADISAGAGFTLTGTFADYPVTVNGLTSSGWRALAQTLAVYVELDAITPLRTGTTGADGRVTFAGLKPGLYLAVLYEPYEHNGHEDIVEPALVSLPSIGADGEWDYDVEANCKYECDYMLEELISYKIKKVWVDGGALSSRPSITVALLRDGKIYDTAVLNAANGWEHEWTDLDAEYDWSAMELNVPGGYTVTVELEGRVFTITNTKGGDVVPTPTPRHTSTPTSQPTPVSIPTPSPSTPPTTPTTPPTDPPKLPQTGMLWWPVGALGVGGLVLIIAGLRRRRGGDDEK